MAQGNILQCFVDADLRCGHLGLTALAKKNGVKVGDLAPGEYVVFINTRRTRVKIYAASNVIAYLNAPRGVSIDLRVIQQIPRAFTGSGALNYDKALENLLNSKLSQQANLIQENTRKYPKKTSPLLAPKKLKERITDVQHT